MRAIVQDRYGPPAEVLRLRDVPRPATKPGQVLVRVRAASIHPDIWHAVTGTPYFLRLMGSGLRRPKLPIPGLDLAGTVEDVGADVTGFQPGDAVFGDVYRGNQWRNGGTFAEYAAMDAGALAPMPSRLDFVEAAAIPTSALIASQNLRGRVGPGDRVLVNGAGGGTGVYLVQLAKAHGATVTAVDASEKLDMLRSIGADEVIDYAVDDFTRSGTRYDLILDVPGNRSFDELKPVLAEDGRYLLIGHDSFGADGGRVIGASMTRFLHQMVRMPFTPQLRPARRSSPRPDDPLAELADLVEAGELIGPVDRTYPLDEVNEALRHLQSGTAIGKLVLTI